MKQYIFLLLLSFQKIYAGRIRAVVTVPVADVTGHALLNASYYSTIPYAPDKGDAACIRLHQIKYNEVVTMVRELHSGEVIIEVPGLFYYDGKNNLRNDFWTLKKYLMPLSKIAKEAQQCVPPAIDRNSPKQGYENVLTLRRPWYNNKNVYSVGTRFIRNKAEDTKDSYGIFFLDYVTKKIHKVLIPRNRALICYHTDFMKARNSFISIVRDWAHLSRGFIPYVWGGISYREPCIDESFEKLVGKRYGHTVSYWERKVGNSVPRSGFDCSNMILCAAQMAGLPYYCKNTHALATTLRPLKSGEKIEDGDLIWYSGHVMVVSDVNKGLVIESIGYDAGYGQLHEIHIANVFKGIHNFNGLRPVHFKRKFIRRLRKDGTPWRSVYHLKILKLSSINSQI